VKANFNAYFWNSAANAYVFHKKNGVQSSVIDDRSNAWAVLAGMADYAKRPGVLTVLKSRNDASPYQEMYIEMAMSMLSPNDALTRMRTRYADMINSSSSTLWEEFPATNSNNHAWSAGPLYQLSAWVLGVQPLRPAYSEFIFQPQVTDLTSISAIVPSVKGDIAISYTRSTNTFTQTVTNPPNTVAIVAVPKGMLAAGVKQIDANGVVVWKNSSPTGTVTGLSFMLEDNAYIWFIVQPGAWTFNAYSQATTANEPAVLYVDCNYSGNAVALPVGNYSLPALIARGIPNDAISSLRVMNGYRAILYWDTDFGGSSLVKTADDACLVDDGWNDALSSVIIQPITAAAVRTNAIVGAGEQEPVSNDNANVKLYPNPASNMLTVYPGNSGYRYLYIKDATGHTVITRALSQDAPYVTIDVSNWGRGVYYALFKGGRKGNEVKKLVIE
jgi:hypothetical protein